MKEIDWNLRTGEMYHLTLRAQKEQFSRPQCSALGYIVGTAIGSALARYPITLHAAVVRSTDVELRFSLTRQQRGNVRPFLKELITAAEETVIQVYADAPKRLFCHIHLDRCRNEATEQRVSEIACRKVRHGRAHRAVHGLRFRAHRGKAVEHGTGFGTDS